MGIETALIMAGGAIIGGAIASDGAQSAADTQARAADRAGQMTKEQADQARADQAPYREAGYKALSTLSGTTGQGGEFNRPFTMADYQEDPGYRFRQKEGEQSITRAAGASGARYSGATLKALQRFNSGLASQEFGNSFNRYQTDLGNRYGRLASMAGIGQTATNQTTVAGAEAARGQAQAIQAAGDARASGYVGTANAITGTIGNLTNAYGQHQMLSSMAKPDPTYGASRDFAGYDAAANGGWGIE